MTTSEVTPDSTLDEISRVTALIRDIPDFPQKGILFKDITPVLADPRAMREVIGAFAEFARRTSPTAIIGIESRGFVFGMPLAIVLELPFIPVRKVGKLPYHTIREEYDLEYGTNAMEIHDDALKIGDRALIVDDLLATGGTASAAARLVERLGATVSGFCFLIELGFLHGRDKLKGREMLSLISYPD